MRIRNLIYFTLLFLGALQASIAQERTMKTRSLLFLQKAVSYKGDGFLAL